MMRSLKIILLTLASLAGAPALAEPEQHRHGQEAASPAVTDKGAAPDQDHDMAEMDAKDGMDNLKAGGKSCKKCKMGMGGAGGHDHGASGMEGGEGAGKGGKGGMGRMGMGGCAGAENLEFRIRQLEKRLDLMQSMLEVLVERRGGGHR